MIKKFVSAFVILCLMVSFVPINVSAQVTNITVNVVDTFLPGSSPGTASLFTNPWTIGIGAAIVITTAFLKSQAHWEANTFVQGFQNPFHAKLAAIVDAENAAYNAGELPLADAQKAWDDTHTLWAEFLRQGDAFGRQGSDEARVWGQAKNTLGPLMIQIFADMQKKLDALQSQSIPGTSSSNKFNVNDSIRVSGTVLNVRETASRTGTLLGRQSANSTGQVIGGPTVQDGLTWWNVDYTNGADGWSAENFLTEVNTGANTSVSTSGSSTPVPVSPATSNPTATIISDFCYTFNTNLTIGSTGTDVISLNTALRRDGFDFPGDGAYFGESMAGAVVSFQAKYGILQSGYVGPITRARLNSMFSCGTRQTSPVAIPVVPTTQTPLPTVPQTGTPAVNVRVIGSSSIQNNDGTITVEQGDNLSIIGIQSGLSGLQYGTDYSRAFFFDTIFDSACSDSTVSFDQQWTLGCTAKNLGSSKFYIEIYKNGQTYRSNTVTVTVVPARPTTQPVSGTPGFYQGPFQITSVACGDVATFRVQGYTGSQVWLVQEKLAANGNSWAKSFEGIHNVPDTYVYVCNKDEGTYSNSVYSVVNGQRGGLIGNTMLFKVNPSASVPPTTTVPTSNMTASVPAVTGPSTVQAGTSANYSFVSTDQDSAGYNGGAITYSVNWGDSSITSSSGLSSGTAYSTSHTWATSGVYPVNITATPTLGNSSSKTVYVTVAAPVVFPTPVTSASCSFALLGSSNVTVGNSLSWAVTSYPTGLTAYWYGKKNTAVDLSGSYAGVANFTQSYTYQPGDEGSYERYLVLKDASGNPVCTTSTLKINVSSAPSVVTPPPPTPVNPPPPPPITTTPSAYCSFALLGSSAVKVGNNLSWAVTSSPTGLTAYWYGKKNNAVDVSGSYAGVTDFTQSYTYQPGDVGSYERYLVLKDASGNPVCTTETVNIYVTAQTALAPSDQNLANTLSAIQALLESMGKLLK